MTRRLLFPARSMNMPVPDEDSCTWGMLLHISTLLGSLIPFCNFLAPLTIWLIKRKQHPFITDQFKECLNFQISLFLARVGIGLLTWFLVGRTAYNFALIMLFLFWVVFAFIAGIQAGRGIYYRVPRDRTSIPLARPD